MGKYGDGGGDDSLCTCGGTCSVRSDDAELPLRAPSLTLSLPIPQPFCEICKATQTTSGLLLLAAGCRRLPTMPTRVKRDEREPIQMLRNCQWSLAHHLNQAALNAPNPRPGSLIRSGVRGLIKARPCQTFACCTRPSLNPAQRNQCCMPPFRPAGTLLLI